MQLMALFPEDDRCYDNAIATRLFRPVWRHILSKSSDGASTNEAVIRFVSDNRFALLTDTDSVVLLKLYELGPEKIQLIDEYNLGKADNKRRYYGRSFIRANKDSIVCYRPALAQLFHFGIRNNQLTLKNKIDVEGELNDVILPETGLLAFAIMPDNLPTRWRTAITTFSLNDAHLEGKHQRLLKNNEACVYDGCISSNNLILSATSGIMIFKFDNHLNIIKEEKHRLLIFDLDGEHEGFLGRLRLMKIKEGEFTVTYRDWFQNAKICTVSINEAGNVLAQSTVGNWYRNDLKGARCFFSPVNKILFARENTNLEVPIFGYRQNKKVCETGKTKRIEAYDILGDKLIFATFDDEKSIYFYRPDK